MVRKSFQYIFLIAFLFVTIEIISYGFFGVFRDRFTFFDFDLYRVQADYLAEAEKKFDARLGWENHYPTPLGERPRDRSYSRDLLSTYGDSYTHSDEVEDNQTWQTFLSAEIQSDVYNFGVGGFCTGQAYLRFHDEFPQHPTPVVALGLITENINRAVSVFRPYYYPATLLRLTKPRYILKEDKLVLKENPIQAKTDLPKLMDDGFLRAVGAGDWWFNRDDYPIFGFPYTAILANKRIWKEAFFGKVGQPVNDMNPRPWEELWSQDEPRELMFALFDRFFDEARGQGARPLLLIFPQRKEVEYRMRLGHLPDPVQTILGHCQARALDCIEMVSVFAAHVVESGDPGTLDRLFRRAHVSPEGNQLVALRIASWLLENHLSAQQPVHQSATQSNGTAFSPRPFGCAEGDCR